MEPQEKYLKGEQLAVETTLEKLPQLTEMLKAGSAVNRKAFLRLFDAAFALGFETARLMVYHDKMDIRKVDTDLTLLDV